MIHLLHVLGQLGVDLRPRLLGVARLPFGCELRREQRVLVLQLLPLQLRLQFLISDNTQQ